MHVSVFYQLPICNLFTQHVIYLLWRDTTSELWTPVLFSLLIKQPQAILFTFCNYFSANSFHSIRLILCFSKTGEIDNLTESLGQSILVVLCAGSTLFLTPVVRPANSQTATPSEATLFSYWSIKPWFLTEGKLAAVLIIPSSWGSQRIAITRASSAIFWRRCRGEEALLQGESLTSNLFTLLLFCLFYFRLLCYIKNTKKLVIAFILVA